MKRLLFLLLFIPALAFGQKATTYSSKALTYSSKAVTFNYCDEFQAVYDAFTTKPTDEYAAYWNTMVSALVDAGYWSLMDVFYFYAVHTNDDGEALLDWKQPTGGSDVVVDGDMSNPSAWTTVQAGWEITGGKAVATATTGFLLQSGILTKGKTYSVTYTISDYSGGGVSTVLGSTFGSTYSANGTYTEIVKCATSTSFGFDGKAAFTGKIDNVSVIEWTNATAYNAPTFTAYEGITGNGTTQYIDCNWVPSVSGVNYTQNSASQIIYIRTDIGANNTTHGTTANTDGKQISINPGNAARNGGIRNNDNTYSSTAIPDASGMFVNTRTAAAVKKLYRNKVAIINAVTPSVGVPTHSPYCLAYNDDDVAAGFRADQVACYAFGAGLSQTAVNTISNAINTCLTSMGKNVY